MPNEPIPSPHMTGHHSKMPLISVIMAGHNAQAYVQDAVCSILAQTEGDFELLFLDDGSTDKTAEIVASIDDPRIILLHNEEQRGIPFSCNRLLQECRGEFIAQMDADDISLPDRLMLQTNFMRENSNIWVSSGSFTVFNDDGEYLQKLLPDHDQIKAAMLFFCPLAKTFSILRAEPFKKYDIRYDEKMVCSLDYELWLRLATKFPEARFANLENVLGKYRRHATQVSTAKAKEQANMATRAQMQVFLALGFSPACREIAHHAYMYHGKPLKNTLDFQRVYEWAVMLRKANEAKKLFPLELFSQNLLNRLQLIAAANLTAVGEAVRLLKMWTKSASR